jgi:hypothetical protein
LTCRAPDAPLWHPRLRINRVQRVMLHTRWSAEAWAPRGVECGDEKENDSAETDHAAHAIAPTAFRAHAIGSHFARPVGRMARSAMSRSFRAISIGSPLSTSFAASSNTSYCADRISVSMILDRQVFLPVC